MEVFLAFFLRLSRLRGEGAVPHLPPRRKERKESAKQNNLVAAKLLREDPPYPLYPRAIGMHDGQLMDADSADLRG